MTILRIIFLLFYAILLNRVLLAELLANMEFQVKLLCLLLNLGHNI